jgi:hypothetical protein
MMTRVVPAPRSITRVHTLVACVVCVALPGLSWLDGWGSLAWTMFASSGSFRLQITTTTAGREQPFNPTALAAHALPSAAAVLAGSDHLRHASSARLLQPSLPELAQLTCRLSGADAVEVALEWTRALDAPLQRAVANASCRLL